MKASNSSKQAFGNRSMSSEKWWGYFSYHPASKQLLLNGDKASNEKSSFPDIKVIFSHGSCGSSLVHRLLSGTFGGVVELDGNQKRSGLNVERQGYGRYETTSLRYPPPRGSNSGRNRYRELTNTATTVAAANYCARRCGSNAKRFGMGCYSSQRFMKYGYGPTSMGRLFY
ncbi:hypothetical protein Tco_1002532 [Tanacetum coccineum]|uniref:Uncharacterized protein n=1 Tax=Tanacetum coccineum TaxID=301880 RepID=A0ABQ5F7L9_9ASTR